MNIYVNKYLNNDEYLIALNSLLTLSKVLINKHS